MCTECSISFSTMHGLRALVPSKGQQSLPSTSCKWEYQGWWAGMQAENLPSDGYNHVSPQCTLHTTDQWLQVALCPHPMPPWHLCHLAHPHPPLLSNAHPQRMHTHSCTWQSQHWTTMVCSLVLWTFHCMQVGFLSGIGLEGNVESRLQGNTSSNFSKAYLLVDEQQ